MKKDAITFHQPRVSLFHNHHKSKSIIMGNNEISQSEGRNTKKTARWKRREEKTNIIETSRKKTKQEDEADNRQ
jgi:hypothetical protein